MRLGVDASNLRDGGGITHLLSLLSVAHPPDHGFSKVLVWGAPELAAALPARPWLQPSADTALSGSLPRRVLWQRFTLPKLAGAGADMLWTPGGNAVGAFRPFVTMCRNMLPFEPEERARYGASWMRVRLSLLESSQARTMRRADGVMFLTDHARERVTRVAGPLRGDVVTIPHGVAERFRRAPRPQRPAEQYSAASPFRLTAISIIDVYKHQWVVAEAAARLRAKGFPIVLDLVGGAYPPALRRLRSVLERVDPDGRTVRYIGKVPFDKLHETYHAADAFVFASSCENLPNILLEAMAAGLPIACSDRGPMPDILGDAGVYFDPEDVGSAEKAIETLVTNVELRERIAGEAYRRAQAYTWSRCAEDSLRFLGSVGRKAASP